MPQVWSGGPAAMVDGAQNRGTSMLELVRNKNNMAELVLKRRYSLHCYNFFKILIYIFFSCLFLHSPHSI